MGNSESEARALEAYRRDLADYEEKLKAAYARGADREHIDWLKSARDSVQSQINLFLGRH